MSGTSSPTSVSTKLQRIAELARESPRMVFTTLAHHIDVDFLREAFRRTRKNGAAGVDGVTAQQYAENLDANLQDLLNRFKSGSYRAPPVRRVYIPKGDGKSLRPLGIPALEDKVLQRAVLMVLEAVYEQDFLPSSFGFRPRKSAHDALADVRKHLMATRGGWVIDIDIEKFFDTLEHPHLHSFLDQRVRDGVVRRTIGKWLNAGVLDGTELQYPEEGTPQGGVVSPLLANIYLHEVLDKWFEAEVKPRLIGPAHLVRYADDALIVVALEIDARKLMEVLPKRMNRFGLKLHPEKTRLVTFTHPYRNRAGLPSQTFNFLGFTHHWGQTRKGGWAVKVRTAKDRFSRALKKISQWCRKNRHLPIRVQHGHLLQKVRGHRQYFGVASNGALVAGFTHHTGRIWLKWLGRRSELKHPPNIWFGSLAKRHPIRSTRAAKP